MSKYKILLYILIFPSISYMEGQTPITPELKYEIKRKFIKHSFANSVYQKMEQWVDEKGNFNGNQNKLSKRAYTYGGSGIQNFLGFGYGFATQMTMSIEPFKVEYPDTSWDLYKIKFSLPEELVYIKGIFPEIPSKIRNGNWYYIIGINENGDIKKVSDNFYTESNLAAFKKDINPDKPESFISLIKFWLKVEKRKGNVEAIEYEKKEDNILVYKLTYPDSFNYAKAYCHIPTDLVEEQFFLKIITNESHKAKKAPFQSGFKNEHITERFLRDNIMKNIYAYELASNLSRKELKQALDNYMMSDGNILEDLLPDFDEVFYYGMDVRYIGLNRPGLRAYEVFAPECQVLVKSPDALEWQEIENEISIYFRPDTENCINFVDVNPDYERKKKELENLKVSKKNYEENMNNWSGTTPPPPPPTSNNLTDNLMPMDYEEGPTIYNLSGMEEGVHLGKKKYLVVPDNETHFIYFFSGEDIFLDPILEHYFGRVRVNDLPGNFTNYRCCDDKYAIDNGEKSKLAWKHLASLRLRPYSTPWVFIENYLDYYEIKEFSPEKIVIETYGIKKGTPWTKRPIKEEEFNIYEDKMGIGYWKSKFNGIPRFSNEKPRENYYDYIRYGSEDRVKIRITFNYEKDYEWYEVEFLE